MTYILERRNIHKDVLTLGPYANLRPNRSPATSSSSGYGPGAEEDQPERRETDQTMPSRSPRRPGPLPPSASSRRRGAAEPPPGLFPAREDLLRLLAVLTIASAAAAACSRLNRRPEPFCDSVQSPDDYADGTTETSFLLGSRSSFTASARSTSVATTSK